MTCLVRAGAIVLMMRLSLCISVSATVFALCDWNSCCSGSECWMYCSSECCVSKCCGRVVMCVGRDVVFLVEYDVVKML